MEGSYLPITTFGSLGGSQHTTHEELMGGRTAITTEALVAYNNLRGFLGLTPVSLEEVGRWAFSQGLTNNTTAWGDDEAGVGLWYAMQGAKVGWIADQAFEPQLIADLQRTARLGDPNDVVALARTVDRDGFIEALEATGGIEAFINTLKMEPHYGGWMHSRAHGWLALEGDAIAHDVNHLTVLSHDQSQPFMNDTFNWPQWPALEVPHAVVIDYFQSMVSLSDPTASSPEVNEPSPQPTPTPTPTPDPLPEPEPQPAPTPGSGINTDTALELSLLFYDANRSGDLDEASNRIPWRGDSGLNDGGDGIYFGDATAENLQVGLRLDLTGGYHDAGDHVKFGLPLASTLSTLAWGGISFTDGYQATEQMDALLDTVRWGTDYLLKAQGRDDAGATTYFIAQVGDGHADHALWSAPEEQTIQRPAMAVTPEKPGSDVAAASAAALASASILFRQSGDQSYADTLLDASESLYAFADCYRGKYSDSIEAVQSFYNSWSGYDDELAYGAAWLARAVEADGGDGASYRATALDLYQNEIVGLNNGWTHNWDDASYATAVLLAQDIGDAGILEDVRSWLDSWVEGTNGVQITDGGLRHISPWGSLRYAANTAMMAGEVADKLIDPEGRYSQLASETIDYILGSNPRQSSYVVGYGDNFPLQPHHRAASGVGWDAFNSDQPNEHVLYGALVGGPSAADDFAYTDSRSDYISNEVAIDYNAGFTGALAFLNSQPAGMEG